MSPSTPAIAGSPVHARTGSLLESFDRDLLTISQRCGQLSAARRDPLGDVITWLDRAELGDDFLLGDSVPAGSTCSGGVRELFADMPMPSDGVESATVRSRGEVSGGIQQLHASRVPQLKPRPSSSSTGGREKGLGKCCCSTDGGGGSETRNFSFGQVQETEDEEWELRQKQTGAAGRLVIYEYGEKPRDDVMLRGGNGRRIMVTAVNEDGKADRAGVKAGDVLVSINGKKDFIGYSADIVHASLVAPVLLVFLGFVGKLQAEVRLNYAEDIAGMALQENFLSSRPEATVQILEEVVFQPHAAGPIFLATDTITPHSDPQHPSCVGMSNIDDLNLEGEASLDLDGMPRVGFIMDDCSRENTALSMNSLVTSSVYELHVDEAKHLVQAALNRAQGAQAPFHANGSLDSQAANAKTSGPQDRAQSQRVAAAAKSPFAAVMHMGSRTVGPTKPSDPVGFVATPASLRGGNLGFDDDMTPVYPTPSDEFNLSIFSNDVDLLVNEGDEAHDHFKP